MFGRTVMARSGTVEASAVHATNLEICLSCCHSVCPAGSRSSELSADS
jgi:hypothetical protein